MKILVLGPLNYTSARKDLELMNYNKNLYSNLFAFEGFYAHYARKEERMDSETAMMLLLADQMTQKEYDSFELFFGLAPKKYKFDMVICYNYDLLSSQEAALQMNYRDFKINFYTTDDLTHKSDNIMEAILLAQSKTTVSDSKQSE